MARSALVVYVFLLCGAMQWSRVVTFFEEEPCELGTPVCGNDGKTYKNICHLYMAQNEDHRLLLFHKGLCRQTLGYKVRKLTTNKHQTLPKLETRIKAKLKTNPQLLLHGKQYCPRKWDPVCGSDGRTYANKCHLLYQTMFDSTLGVLYTGQCQSGKKKLRNPNRNRTSKRSIKRTIRISG